MLAAFRTILKKKGAADVDGWVADCDATLRAAIRTDAVWVNRYQCFLEMDKATRPSEDDAAKHLFSLMKSRDDYFLTVLAEDAKDRNFSQTCGIWISINWGVGQKSDDGQIIRILKRLSAVSPRSVVGRSGSQALAAMLAACPDANGDDAESLYAAIGWRGRPSKARLAVGRMVDASSVKKEMWDRFLETAKEECEKRKVARKESVPGWATALKKQLPAVVGLPFQPAAGRSHHYEHATMLSFAARRVSQIHTKAKQAEAERQSFGAEQSRMALVPAAAKTWLDRYVQDRSDSSGAADGYQLRRRAVSNWSEVTSAWQRCSTSDDRIAAVREMQADWEKPGDSQLFEAIAADDGRCVWQGRDGRPDSDILINYVRSTVADDDAVRFKVPAYRHPDPLRSPSFLAFGNSQWTIDYSAQSEAQARRKSIAKLKGSAKQAEKAKEHLASDADLHHVSLVLWKATALAGENYRWQSKRFEREMSLASVKGLEGIPVARADRFGRASAGAGPFIVSAITLDDAWNGRLQAPRRQLEDLARAADAKELPYDDESKWPKSLKQRLEHIGWFLSHSARLTPSGPWLDYVQKGLPDGWQWATGRDGPYLFRADNKERKGRAKFILSRLPGLRVLSIDLGLRTSAAAAVWEVVPGRAVTAAKRDASEVSEGDLYCIAKDASRTQVFRRIGDSAWARLDRQFLIKLDGEKSAARHATGEEWKAVQDLRRWLGCAPEPARRRHPAVDRLQQSAVRLCQLGLRRLGDIARVSYLLTSDKRPTMGGRNLSLDREGRIASAQDALVIWHTLASSDEFVDAEMKNLWSQFVGDAPPLAAGLTKKQKVALRDELRSAAERLAGNKSAGKAIADVWRQREGEWRARLRWLRSWIVPRFSKKTSAGRVPVARNVGGLSLDRISTIRSVYQVLRAFSSKPEPKNLRAGVERIEEAASKKLRPEFGRRMLEKMERLRENRVKQIASRIVEAALGVGSESVAHWEKGRKRPSRPIDDPRFSPCHAVVIENLDNYRPDDKRTRRENRSLMTWAARAVRKYLMEGCQLHGLYLREVSPSYTSRQDSRTGCPGMRCNDVPIAELVAQGGWYERQLARAAEAVKDGKATSRQMLMLRMAEAATSGRARRPFMRLISPGGQVFVAADARSPSRNGIHADMNAAANIGLVALLDPDWPGSWWRLLCDPSSGKIDDSKLTGSACLPVDVALLEAAETKGKTLVNAWSDPEAGAVRRRKWQHSREFWGDVESRVLNELASWNVRR